jgi:hypothetical protein
MHKKAAKPPFWPCGCGLFINFFLKSRQGSTFLGGFLLLLHYKYIDIQNNKQIFFHFFIYFLPFRIRKEKHAHSVKQVANTACKDTRSTHAR